MNNSRLSIKTKHFLVITSLIIFLISSLMLPIYASQVGQVEYVRGVVSATDSSKGMRFVNRNAPINEKDTIQTSRDSMAVLRFIDGTSMTLRPYTVFRVDEYHYENSLQDKDRGIFSLLKGGFRALSGFLSKTSPRALSVRTPTATIGVRGTEFDVRLCESSDCAQTKTNASKTNKKPQRSEVVGRVAFKNGKLIAFNSIRNTRHTVHTGGPIYEGDRLITGAADFAVVSFTDQSRITLLRNSQLVVEQFKYDPEQKEESRSFFNLLRGGLRAVTGLIAGVNPSQVKYKTVNATIGVRGTGFDIICDGKCEPTTGSKSMQVNVWDGSIVIQQPDIETVVTSGHSASINSPFNKPSVSPSNSREMQKIPSRPDQMKIDFDALFGATEMSETAPEEGLYVGVYEGHVNVENDLGQSVDIGAGEAAFSGVSGSVVRLDKIPDFQRNDAIPSPDDVTTKIENSMNLLFDSAQVSTDSLECSIN